ncbi:MAG: hypothetical protein HKN56_10495 [Gammaproteobacteria bacterium]|nr:hypothetical protein [Gammaproteobacteria bacterium]
MKVSKEKQAELQLWFDAYAAQMDDKYFGQVGEMNGRVEFEDRFHETEYARFLLRVTRGDVMEKAGRMMAPGKKLSPGRGDGILTWGRFYSLDMHPKTPLVGMLHATIVMQMFEDDSVTTGGWLGVMPGTRVEEDLALLKKVTDNYFARHDKDPSLYRQLICKGTHDTVAQFRRKPACSGVSFYGPPVYADDPEASIRFIAGLYDEFVGTYMDIVRERQGDTYTAADIEAQDGMRRQWLIDQLFSDPFSGKIIPFEIWSFANVPPVVKF